MIKVFLTTIVNFIVSKIPWIENDTTFKEVFEFVGLDVNDYKKSPIKSVLYNAIIGDYDISYLSNPKLTVTQFYLIKKGMDHGLDVSIFADPSLPINDMKFFLYILQKIKTYEKENTFKFINKRLSHSPISLLEYKMIKLEIDILKFGVPEMVVLSELIDRNLIYKILPKINNDLYTKKSHDYKQLIEITLGLIHDLNVSKYFDPDLPAFMMRRERLKLMKNLKVFTEYYHK